MSLPTIWQNDALLAFLKDAGYKAQWNDGLKEYLVYILSASPYLTLNDLLKSYHDTYGTWEIQFTPDDLFVLGQNGLWWDATSTSYITQDSLGTIPVTGATDPVGLMIDRSGNGNDGIQATTSLKPTYQVSPSRLVFDNVDDTISSNNLTTTGDVVIGTTNGVLRFGASFTNTPLNLPNSTIIGSSILEVVTRDTAFSQSEYVFLKQYLVDRGAPSITVFTGTELSSGLTNIDWIVSVDASEWDTSGVTSLDSTFFNMTNLSSIDGIENLVYSSCTSLAASISGTQINNINLNTWDTSGIITLGGFAFNCTSLTDITLDTWDVSNVTDISYFMSGCTSLVNLDISGWDLTSLSDASGFIDSCTSLTTLNVGNAFDNTPCIFFESAFYNCALSQTSIDSILISINNAGTSNGFLGANGGTNATPSIAGKAATDALRARGWTVTLNGY